MQNQGMIHLLKQLRESVVDGMRQRIDDLLADVRLPPIGPVHSIL